MTLDVPEITKSVLVPLTPEAAFDLFTRGINRWWPGDRRARNSPASTPSSLTMEPFKGGQITETTPDGKRRLRGHIIGWEPGKYLSFEWLTDDAETEAAFVSIVFVATPQGTRVELTCGGVSILGELAHAVSTSVLRGWELVLGCYDRYVADELVLA